MDSRIAPGADTLEPTERIGGPDLGSDSPPLVPSQEPTSAAVRMRRKRERERNGERVWQFTLPDELVDDFLTLNGVSETTPLTVEERVELQEKLNRLLIQAMRDRS